MPYESLDSLTAALRGVHTVLFCLKIVDPGQMEATHLNLIHASIAAGTVQRFSPSDFSLGPRTHKTVDLLANKSTLLKACQDLVASQSSDIEIAQFQNGMFMQYLAQKLPNPDEPAVSGVSRKEALLCNLEDPMMLDYIDIASGRLVISTNASGAPAKITTTSITDIGKFVAAALDLPRGSWDGFMGMAGTTATLAEIRAVLAESTNAPNIKDETIAANNCEDIEKKYDAKLAKGFSVEALIGKMVAQMEKASCQDTIGGCIVEPKLNKLCPDVEVIDLRTYLKEVWGAKQEPTLSPLQHLTSGKRLEL